MKIVFNLMNCGCGNNGGTLTIFKSANTLQELGHEVIIVDTGRNQHTWTPLKVEHRIVKNVNDIPKCDTIIATGFSTIPLTNQVSEKICSKKFSWIRAWETWKFCEYDIVHKILNLPITKVVNSLCLKDKLHSFGINSFIIRPGNDLDIYKNNNIRSDRKIVLGGLVNLKHRNIKRMDWILETVKELKSKYKNIELVMMGNDNFSNSLIDKYYRSASEKDKVELYNNIHIWLVPNSQEGLTIPPQEAVLSGCLIIGTSAKMSGTQDYLINDQTGFVSDDNLPSFIRKVEFVVKNYHNFNDIIERGRQKIMQLGDRHINMETFVSVINSSIRY